MKSTESNNEMEEVYLSDIEKGDLIEVADRNVRKVVSITISDSGKTIKFLLEDEKGNRSETTWWRIMNKTTRLQRRCEF
ncbi:hypothetical protein G9G63_09710 [Paenibacillus sp. EKM202P]|uniref:hypothetical protein n=1 Tax=unclassified Paenibacillus TaxID=185978 RepID=UPI0013EAFB1A|nr:MULTISPECIES: hypothetical protein [unclassified Paenibacillus]KAF6565423.1 hypothetical protein G9G63_09710 [Paenibacillus sp. EKM202P]KAF6569252.1 hypothetical protein G9G64_12385 [Paenibacillus sp. EKM207P]